MNAQAASMFSGLRRRGHGPRLSSRTMGVIAAGIAVLFLYVAFHSDQVKSFLTPHETVAVEFPQDFKLVFDSPHYSDVKIAGVIVGKVGDVQRTDRGTALVTLYVDRGTRAKLGSSPSARVVSKLVIGGTYYVQLIPGGAGDYQGGVIPPDRTQVPVELEDVLDSVSTPKALSGVQSSIRQPALTLEQGGQHALQGLVMKAPATLRPAGAVLDGLRGTSPDTDLTRLVHGFESTASAFTAEQDRVQKIIISLDSTTAALAAGSQPLADSINTSAETLRVTRAGLADLQPTLDQLTVTANSFQPAAERLDPFLKRLNPVLDRARPVVEDLRTVSSDLRPIVDHLVPTTSKATDTLHDLHGPALDGLNGLVQKVLYSPWHGKGVYQGDGTDDPLYKEIAYMSDNIGSVMANHDGNVSLARLEAAAGARSVGGQNIPMSSEQFLETMGLQQPPGPQEGKSGTLTSPIVRDAPPSIGHRVPGKNPQGQNDPSFAPPVDANQHSGGLLSSINGGGR